MKLNLGCGQNKVEGYVNVDKYATCNPDLVVDLEVTPWPFKDSEVDEIILSHVLEHLGASTEVFFSIIKELYRVCKNSAKIVIVVPHPRHDDFINDPTHVRIITPDLMALFSKKNCARWKTEGTANSALALYLDVDFDIEHCAVLLEPSYAQQHAEGRLPPDELSQLLKEYNNIATQYTIILRVVK